MIPTRILFMCFFVGFLSSGLPFSALATIEDNALSMPNVNVPLEETRTPTIHYDLQHLPQAVREMRQRIIEAAKSGDIEALRPLITQGDEGTQIRLSEQEGDPIGFLKQLSGDGEGIEILAILLDLLNAGYVVVDEGSPDMLYVWPYFFALPLEGLSKAQMVEAYQIMTAGDFDVMREIGAYTFFRLGISPDGRWRFFLTGD